MTAYESRASRNEVFRLARGHRSMLRAVALALRHLMLRAVALALWHLMLRAVALALRRLPLQHSIKPHPVFRASLFGKPMTDKPRRCSIQTCAKNNEFCSAKIQRAPTTAKGL